MYAMHNDDGAQHCVVRREGVLSNGAHDGQLCEMHSSVSDPRCKLCRSVPKTTASELGKAKTAMVSDFTFVVPLTTPLCVSVHLIT